MPYHLNISMGWDSSPRCGNVTPGEWLRRRDYPFGAVIVDNTPYLFKKYLAEAKAWTLAKPESERIVVINSWNEWGEGSYLEPDTENGMGYLGGRARRIRLAASERNGHGRRTNRQKLTKPNCYE